MRILLVEDDRQVSSLLASTLSRQNHVVDVATDGQEGWDLLEVCPYEMILLDVMLPKLDGISFCKQLRQQKRDVLVMLLTARSDRADRILGLDAGADDYVIKPCDPDEIAARIRALQRRGSSSTPMLQHGQLQLNPAKREITYAGQVLNFRPKEYALLELFLRNPQRIFNRREILDRMWSVEEEPPNESTIKAHIKGIRRVLKSVHAEGLIKTLYGQGYGLNTEFKMPDQAKVEKTQAIVAGIWQQVKGLNFDRLAVIQQAIAQLKTDSLTEPLRADATQNAHQLAGALGMFGFSEGSLIARQLESFFEASEFEPNQTQQIDELVAFLDAYLSKHACTPEKAHAEDVDLVQSTPQASVKVLAIDDDVNLLQLLQTVLSPCGIEIIPLQSSVMLWETIQRLQPDLILLDMKLPNETGLEICRSIRNHSQWQWLPIIFLTVCNELDTQLQVFEAGGDDYLMKPVVPSVLATRILNRVTRFRSIRQYALTQVEAFNP